MALTMPQKQFYYQLEHYPARDGYSESWMIRWPVPTDRPDEIAIFCWHHGLSLDWEDSPDDDPVWSAGIEDYQTAFEFKMKFDQHPYFVDARRT